jgi:RNA-directed DNA polymerase
MERENLLPDAKGELQTAESVRSRVPMREAGADCPVVAMKPGNAGGAKGTGYPEEIVVNRTKREELLDKSKPKSFEISKEIVQKAYVIVKANRGTAGIDGESIEEFERNLKGNLYKLWNRMSSGTYFPPAVRAVEIPKRDGRGKRMLGVPTVTDRIAQTVVRMYLEPEVEPLFHEDSYGYRPGRSALDAVGVCRARCWKSNWVIDLDIKAFFDSLDHELVMQVVRARTDLAWIHLYIGRWLKAPLQGWDGTVEEREEGSPQGSGISPLLSNMYLHEAFDSWMGKTFPTNGFERYCDDIVVHCQSEGQARHILSKIVEQLAIWGLEVNLEKTRIVYCKDDRRGGSHEHQQFDFLGYTFRRRMCKSGRTGYLVGFNPAISQEARHRIGRKIRDWHLRRWVGQKLEDLAAHINRVVRGWVNYYGRYFRGELRAVLTRINVHLVRWAQRKYKRLRRRPGRAWQFLLRVATREPKLFVHWGLGMLPTAG